MTNIMEKEFIEDIKKIYNLLQDDLSKEVFANRLLYNLTDDAKYLHKIIATTTCGSEIYEKLKSDSRKKVIFGAGENGVKTLGVFENIKFECFVDNYRYGENLKGLPIIDINTLKNKYSDALIIISTERYSEEILNQLLHEGFKEENIINIGNEYQKKNHLQYFDLPELKSSVNKKEIFVDAGCYDAFSTCEFKNWCENSGGVEELFVYAWEPDPQNLERCKTTLERSKIPSQLIAKGVWSKPDKFYFESAETVSTITQTGTLQIQVDSIDNLTEGPITFIKMDIEGSEYEALLGAEKTIEKYKPKLAICVYHKPEDIWKLPLLIHKFNPDYKFYLRHYTFKKYETVLYAIDNTK